MKDTKTETVVVNRTKLIISEANPRKTQVKEDLEELRESVEKEGITEPIHVWYNKEKDIYEIMAGQRRFLASAEEEFECILHKDITTLEEAKKWCRREFSLRRDLLPIDLMNIAIELAEKYDGDLKKGCDEEKLPYQTFKHWYHLKNLSDNIKKNLQVHNALEPTPTLMALRELASLPQEKQDNLYPQLISKSTTEATAIIREYKRKEEREEGQILEPTKKFYTLGVSKDSDEILEKQAKSEGKILNEYLEEVLEEKARQLKEVKQ